MSIYENDYGAPILPEPPQAVPERFSDDYELDGYDPADERYDPLEPLYSLDDYSTWQAAIWA